MEVWNKMMNDLFELFISTLLNCLNLSNQKKLKIVPNLLSNSNERISFVFIETYIYEKSFKPYARYNLNCEKQIFNDKLLYKPKLLNTPLKSHNLLYIKKF